MLGHVGGNPRNSVTIVTPPRFGVFTGTNGNLGQMKCLKVIKGYCQK